MTKFLQSLNSRRLRGLIYSGLFGGAACAVAMNLMAGEFEPRWQPGCPGGVCMPKRVTYGYYPTLWRRWPGEPLSNFDPKKEKPPEDIAGPAEPEKDKTHSDKVLDMLDEMNPKKNEEQQSRPLNEMIDEGNDTAPKLPGELEGDLEQPGMNEDLRNQLRDDQGMDEDEPPKRIEKRRPEPDLEPDPGLDKKSDDSDLDSDPFKDDPLEGDSSRLRRPGRSRTVFSSSETSERQTSAMHWRDPQDSASKPSAPRMLDRRDNVVRATSLKTSQPRRLENDEATISSRNPLRASAPPKQRVAPAANWSAQNDELQESAPRRSNPLRGR